MLDGMKTLHILSHKDLRCFGDAVLVCCDVLGTDDRGHLSSMSYPGMLCTRFIVHSSLF